MASDGLAVGPVPRQLFLVATVGTKSVALRVGTAIRRPLTPVQAAGLTCLIVFAGYSVVFAQFGGDWRAHFAAAARNTVSLAAAAIPVGLLIHHVVRHIGGLAEFVVHVALAVLFAYLWYFLLMIAIGLTDARSLLDFDVRPVFASDASSWQVLQGMAMYGMLAAYLGSPSWPAATPVTPVTPDMLAPAAKDAERYFIKQDGDALPIDVDQIVSITGADDYSDVSTIRGRHLVRLTLSRFEKTLDPARFCRVHRSSILNVSRIERFEPDGAGRFVVWMENGEQHRTSREGARKLRSRLI